MVYKRYGFKLYFSSVPTFKWTKYCFLFHQALWELISWFTHVQLLILTHFQITLLITQGIFLLLSIMMCIAIYFCAEVQFLETSCSLPMNWPSTHGNYGSPSLFSSKVCCEQYILTQDNHRLFYIESLFVHIKNRLGHGNYDKGSFITLQIQICH